MLAGTMLTISLVLFIGGFILYIVRLGTWPTYREEAIEIMKWGVSVLFTLILLLAVQQFLLRHLTVAVTIGAIIIAGVIAWVLISSLSEPEKKPERERR